MMKQREESITDARISSKRLKNNTCDLVDMISPLPDSILGVVLSSLPTKNAVATSILSNRWKSLWTTVHNLDFCCEFEEEDGSDAMKPEDGCFEENMKFVRFVNHVMLLHDAGFLNKFRLVWDYCILSHAYSWISTAITKNVHEIFVRAGASEPFRLPLSVFKCVSLRSLELHGHAISVSLCDEIVFCLPRLESLKLVSVYFESEEAFEQLIKGCPVLSYLHLCIDFIDGFDFAYIISSTSLRRLELFFEYETSLKLEASSLEYLKLEGFIFTILVQKSLTSLVEAEFKVVLYKQQLLNAGICNSLVEAVRAFDCAKTLTLSADVMWALNSATISLSTEFKRLERLNIEAYCCYCSSLREFIQSSDNLQVLAVTKYSNCLGADDPHDHSNWTAPIAIPRCLSNNLKKVVLNGYYGYDDEREMICYILMHGSALEAMMISLGSEREGEKFELLQEICDFTRKSPTCRVKFFG